MAELLSIDDRTWLLDQLRELISKRGAQTFVGAPLLTPSPSDFPDPFEPTARGVRVLLRRIMAYADLHDLDVELDTFSQPDEVHELDEHGRAKAWGHEGAAAWFAGIQDGRCFFGVAEERIGEPEMLVATLCHEVAHAYRAFHGLVHADRDEEERLTDLTTIYLGFGILTTNGAYMYRASGGLDGTMTVTQWSHARAGYLPPEAMSFLLAAQVKTRGLIWNERRRIVARLETNQASYFRWAYSRLSDAATLRASLGALGGAVPASPPRHLVAVDDEGCGTARSPLPETPAPNRFNLGQTTYRVARTKVRPYAFWCSVAGLAVGGAASVLSADPHATWVGAALGFTLGLVAGNRKRWDYCADPACAGLLSGTDTTCPSCGGTIAGTLRSPDERLDASERSGLSPRS